MKYRVYLSTKIKAKDLPTSKGGICVIEPEDYTDAQIKAIKAKGWRVLAYLSIGSISTERKYYKTYAKYKKGRLPDWPKEYYMDMTAKPWTDFLIKRAKDLKKRGFSGWWLDNLDIYEYYKSAKMFDACQTLLKNIKKIGGYVMVNGGSEFFDKAMDKKIKVTNLVNGVTQEEVFSLIKNYSGKGKFGEQKADQKKWYKSYMKRLVKNKVQGFLLEYTKDAKVKKKIKNFVKTYKMSGAYVSGDVNL